MKGNIVKKIIFLILFLTSSVMAQDQYVFKVEWPAKTLAGSWGPATGQVTRFSEDNKRLFLIVTKAQYNAGFANLSPVVFSNLFSTANESVASLGEDRKLKAVLEGLVVCINKRLPATNRIDAVELKQAVKERLDK